MFLREDKMDFLGGHKNFGILFPFLDWKKQAFFGVLVMMLYLFGSLESQTF